MDKLGKVNIVFPSYKPGLDLHKSYLSVAEGVGIRNLVDHLNQKYPEYCRDYLNLTNCLWQPWKH